MDPELHGAAMKGNYDNLLRIVHLFNDARTPNGNTVLHVAAQFGHLECVKLILEKCPDLLHQLNSKGETALHIAVRETRDYGTWKALLLALMNCANKVVDPESAGGTNNTRGRRDQMLTAVNEDGDTALHLAARNPFASVGEMIKLTGANPEFQYPPNKAQETPLYLACENGSFHHVFDILNYCRSPAYGGPGGKTALHAAVINKGYIPGEVAEELLNTWPHLVREPDEYGWTPLHYATRANNIAAVSKLLNHDRSVAYIGANNDDYNTALHIAAAQGHTEVMKNILKYCSDCWEAVNGKGQNIYHIAAEMEKKTLLNFLKGETWSKCLLNQKDTNGNTPLHLLASSMKERPFFLWSLFKLGDWGALNHKNLTPLDIALKNDIWTVAMLADFQVRLESKGKKGEPREAMFGGKGSTAINDAKDGPSYIIGWRNVVNDDRERMKKLEEEKRNEEGTNPAQVERFRKMADAHLIVATLIATVTFAAGFTLPGGYNGSEGKNQGTAILLKKVAFKIFIISDTIAVTTATASVFLHVAASLYDDKDELLSRYRKAFYLILIAIGAMVLAFVTGVYVVLAPSQSLAIALCVIGSLVSFLIFIRELIKMDFFSNLWFLMAQELARRILPPLMAFMRLACILLWSFIWSLDNFLDAL